MFSGLLFSLLLLFLLWLPLLCFVSSSFVFPSYGFFFRLLMSLLLLFLFGFPLLCFVVSICGFPVLWLSGLVAFRSSVFFFLFLCLIVFFSLLLSLLLSVFCFISSVSVFFCIRSNNSALVFCLHKKKNGGSFTAIDFFYSLVYLFGMISYFTSMIISSKILSVLLSYITIDV